MQCNILMYSMADQFLSWPDDPDRQGAHKSLRSSHLNGIYLRQLVSTTKVYYYCGACGLIIVDKQENQQLDMLSLDHVCQKSGLSGLKDRRLHLLSVIPRINMGTV